MRTRRNYATPDFQSTGKDDVQRFSSAHAKSAADSANSVIPDLVKLFEQSRVAGLTATAMNNSIFNTGTTLSAVGTTLSAVGTTLSAVGTSLSAVNGQISGLTSNQNNMLLGFAKYKTELATLSWPSGTESTVGYTHALGATALGYVVINQTGYGVIINGGNWTSNYCDFRWTTNLAPPVIGTLNARLLVFVNW